MMPYRNAPRGGPSAQLPPDAFVSFIQNHDQIGNRAFGERLNVLAPPEVMRALASVYLLAPQIPMLFMGEEWGATSPFLFFCDFSGELAEAVRKGRREEFSRFPEFADPERVAKIPDPCAESTFPRLQARLEPDRRDASRLLPRSLEDPARTSCSRCCLPFDMVARRSWWVSRLCASSGGPASAGSSSTPISRPAPSSFRRRQSRPFWLCGDAGASFGPWTVRWGFDPE